MPGRCCQSLLAHMQNVSEMSKADRLPSRSEDAQIAARIHNARPHPGVLQRLDGAIDGKTFRDAAEINRKRAAKHHRSRFPIENNIAPVATGNQFVRRDIECAVRPRGQDLSRAQDAKGPSVDRNRPKMREPVQPTQFASRIMKIHQPMHATNRTKSRFHPTLDGHALPRPRRHIDKGAEQWARPPHFNAARHRKRRAAAARHR